VKRFERELGKLRYDGSVFEGGPHEAIWSFIQEYTPHFLQRHPDGVVVRVSCTLKEVESVLESLEAPAIVRAGSGVVYAYFPESAGAAKWCAEAVRRGGRLVIEYCSPERKRELDLWPSPGNDLALCEKVKHLFDPQGILNHGRLYGRI
jgi:FAD/FMN-containing dehydrogenase